MLSVCTTAHPLYTGFTKGLGAFFLTRQCDRTLGRTRGAGGRRRRARGGVPGDGLARSHCRFVLPLIHFTLDSQRESVPLFLERRRDRTLGDGLVEHAERRAADAVGAAGRAAAAAGAVA